ncbi:MAG: LysR family transcriptional regulator [Burkholderiales bacterium]|nr:LysR family transcriptional regulator [Burkholderiales bacterium]
MELRQLNYFVAVAEELHFGRAANKLNMTQPPLSQAIQGLETQLGAQLFTRTTRHIALSAAGRALLPEAKRLLAQAQALPELTQAAALGKTGELALAFISVADYNVLPPALRYFTSTYPHVNIHLREATSDQQYDLLAQSDIDLGFLIPPVPAHLQHLLTYRKLRSEALMMAIPASEAQRKFKSNLATYKDLPLILFPRKIAPALHDTILACFRDAGLTPRISQEAIQMQTIIALVSANLGMALVPASMSNLKRDGVAYLPLKSTSAELEIGVAWRKDNASPALQAFLNQLHK